MARPLESVALLLPWVVCCCCAHPSVAMQSSACRDERCGDLAVPYPFGVGLGCGLPDYRIACRENSSFGPGRLAFLGTTEGEVQVLGFSMDYLTVNSTYLKAMPSYDYASATCPDASGNASFGLPDAGPFVISESSYFVVIGCRSYGTCTTDSGKDGIIYNLECRTGCYNEFALPYCNFYSCCLASIPPATRFLNLTGVGIAYQQFPGVCGFSTVLSENRYTNTRHAGVFAAGDYGLDISWGILLSNGSQNCATVAGTAGYACADNSTCQDNPYIPGYVCNCTEGFRGDGYRNGTGCSDIDECAEHLDNCEPPPLGKCTNTKGSFFCNCTHSVGNGTTCVATTKSNILLPALAGALSMAVGIIVLGLIFLWSWKSRELRKKKSRYFQINGGIQLQEFVSSTKGREAARLFSLAELERATQKFSDHLKIGTGGFGTVYKGTLNNNSVVAIKKSKHMQQEQVDQFINEIIILSQINHRNIVWLLGCCLETQVPLLVYEFISNGTLFEHLQLKSGMHLSWDIRLQIAIETAQSLEYLHSAASPPIFHRDVKSSNILLDKNFTPKVSDFGASRLVPLDHTHVSTLVQGTIGYLDPEYFRTFQLTDKSDVYSFGVVLFELITSLKPYSTDRGEGNSNLAMLCCAQLEMGEFSKLIDPSLLTDSDYSHLIASINHVAILANKCLSLEGHRRPSMRDVFEELLWIRGSKHAELYHEVTENDIRPLLPYSERSHTQREFDSIIMRAEKKDKEESTKSSFSSGLGSLEAMMLKKDDVSRR